MDLWEWEHLRGWSIGESVSEMFLSVGLREPQHWEPSQRVSLWEYQIVTHKASESQKVRVSHPRVRQRALDTEYWSVGVSESQVQASVQEHLRGWEYWWVGLVLQQLVELEPSQSQAALANPISLLDWSEQQPLDLLSQAEPSSSFLWLVSLKPAEFDKNTKILISQP